MLRKVPLFLLFIAIIGVYCQDEEAGHDVVHRRSRRSLTAFLAAEVLILERILAAQQNSRKPRKISPRPVQSVNSVVGGSSQRLKHIKTPVTHAPVQIFKFSPPSVATKPPRPSVSSLDPFTMLRAPDLSKSISSEYQSYSSNPTIFPSSSSPVESENKLSPSRRHPRQRTLHYGAYELYQL